MARSQIGLNLQAAREAAGMGQDEAAAKAKIHPQTLSKYERGAIKKVPVHVLERLAPIYQTSVPALMATNWNGLSRTVPRGTLHEPAPGYGDPWSALIARLEREAIRRGATDAEADLIRAVLELPSARAIGAQNGAGAAEAFAEAFVDWMISMRPPAAKPIKPKDLPAAEEKFRAGETGTRKRGRGR